MKLFKFIGTSIIWIIFSIGLLFLIIGTFFLYLFLGLIFGIVFLLIGIIILFSWIFFSRKRLIKKKKLVLIKK